MEAIPDGSITAVRAVLQQNGAIDLDVSVPGWDEVQTTRIRSSLALVLRGEVDPAEIDLERGDDGTSRLVQEAVRQRLAWLNEKLEQKRDYQRVAAPRGGSARGGTTTHGRWPR